MRDHLDIYDDLTRRAGMPIKLGLLPREKLLDSIEKYIAPAD